jgi:hypothetical protein
MKIITSEHEAPEPEHDFKVAKVVLKDSFDPWWIAHCKCGWESDPKCSELHMEDEIATHVLEVAGE